MGVADGAEVVEVGGGAGVAEDLVVVGVGVALVVEEVAVDLAEGVEDVAVLVEAAVAVGDLVEVDEVGLEGEGGAVVVFSIIIILYPKEIKFTFSKICF